MSIDVELTLIMGLFVIGALVLAVDNLTDALYRRFSRWMCIRSSPACTSQAIRSRNYKKPQQ
ncbi:MAG: hypothetical protein K0S45_3618 [Nitrospira sp.]|jgi:hypothetical protein|nr:hypothetical protein [Nitrospira sp.]